MGEQLKKLFEKIRNPNREKIQRLNDRLGGIDPYEYIHRYSQLPQEGIVVWRKIMKGWNGVVIVERYNANEEIQIKHINNVPESGGINCYIVNIKGNIETFELRYKRPWDKYTMRDTKGFMGGYLNNDDRINYTRELRRAESCCVVFHNIPMQPNQSCKYDATVTEFARLFDFEDHRGASNAVGIIMKELVELTDRDARVITQIVFDRFR